MLYYKYIKCYQKIYGKNLKFKIKTFKKNTF